MIAKRTQSHVDDGQKKTQECFKNPCVLRIPFKSGLVSGGDSLQATTKTEKGAWYGNHHA